MEREHGKVVRTLDLDGYRPYFLLDKQNNIIRVDSLSKNISLLNFNLDVLIQNEYSDYLEDVFITKGNKLAFICVDKTFVIYV